MVVIFIASFWCTSYVNPSTVSAHFVYLAFFSFMLCCVTVTSWQIPVILLHCACQNELCKTPFWTYHASGFPLRLPTYSLSVFASYLQENVQSDLIHTHLLDVTTDILHYMLYTLAIHTSWDTLPLYPYSFFHLEEIPFFFPAFPYHTFSHPLVVVI